MGCGNNCAGCACDETEKPLEASPEAMIKKLASALMKISLKCDDSEWAKSDIKRIALEALGVKP